MKEIKNLSLIIVLIFFTQLVFGQLEKRMDKIFQTSGNKPGYAIGIFHGDSIVFKKGYGNYNLETKTKINPNTIFDIGSMSKQFTAACIVLLIEEGKLSLDTPIHKFIPELPKYEGTPITVSHLLYHTSGIRGFYSIIHLQGKSWEEKYSNDQILDVITRQKNVNFPPETKYAYSNSGYFLLGLIVERVSGVSLQDFCQEHILNPLGMQHTYLYGNIIDTISNRAKSYFKNHKERKFSGYDFIGTGGIYTNVNDFFLWHSNLIINKIGSDNFLELMKTKGKLSNGKVLNYGAGLEVGDFDGNIGFGHSGSNEEFHSYGYCLSDYDIGFVVLCNSRNVFSAKQRGLLLELLASEYSIVPKQKQIEVEFLSMKDQNTKLLSSFQGHYDGGFEGSYDIKLKDNVLYAKASWRKKEFPIQPISDSILYSTVKEDRKFVFFSKNGNLHLKYTSFGNDYSFEKKKSRKEIQPTNQKQYVGVYYSPELDADFEVVIQGKNLVCNTPTHKKLPITFFDDMTGYFKYESAFIELEFLSLSKSGLFDGFFMRNYYHGKYHLDNIKFTRK